MATSSGIFSLFSLAGQTAICTGGSKGIGQAMAIALAEAGADIILPQRDISNEATKSQIEALGRKAYMYAFDSLVQESVTALLPAVLKDGHSPTILINCAGIGRLTPVAQHSDKDWNDTLQVNLNSIFALSRDFGAYLLSKPADAHGRRGSIINVASILAFQGGFMVAAYAASKGGLVQLTRAMSNEWAKEGINVNALAPGWVKTDMTVGMSGDPQNEAYIRSRIPAGRWGAADDFKGVTVFMASRASAWMHGETIAIDGGWTSW